MNGWKLAKYCIHFDIDKIEVGIVLRQFAKIYKSNVRILFLHEWMKFDKLCNKYGHIDALQY